jgi:hypothetical protein
MGKVFGREIQAIHLAKASETARATALNSSVAEMASRLGTITPPSRQVRVSGVLDMIRHSTRGFTLRIQNGEEVHGVMESTESPGVLQEFFGKEVLVLGRAVYRPSGRLLRIDAVGLEDGAGSSSLFSRVPPARTDRPVAAGRLKVAETGKRGVPGFFGTWPGDETDAEMESMLRDVRDGQALVQ